MLHYTQRSSEDETKLEAHTHALMLARTYARTHIRSSKHTHAPI